MRRAALAALLAVALVAAATPVAGHGNHVEVDSQHSTDGTVVVEAVRPLTDGFLVLHRATDDGEVGQPIGHTAVEMSEGFRQGVPVEMDDTAWADWPESGTLWVVFHADSDGDGEFDAGTDERASAFGAATGQAVTVARSDRPASVVAERARAQQTASATATVSRAVLPEDGFLVLRTDSGTDGRVVGAQTLDAGAHEDVSVDFDASAFPANRSTVGLYAQLYTDDGDAAFSEGDSLVRAGDSPVSSYFLVWQVDEESATTDGPVVQTPGDDSDVVTPTETSDATASESDTGVPGYGVVHAVVAVALTAVLLARR